MGPMDYAVIGSLVLSVVAFSMSLYEILSRVKERKRVTKEKEQEEYIIDSKPLVEDKPFTALVTENGVDEEKRKNFVSPNVAKGYFTSRYGENLVLIYDKDMIIIWHRERKYEGTHI